ncbi:MAG: hypothetical protein LBU23_09385, partial [Planctomycetota bacterium]|nr:hypothetical protein [Planctomycetota bacterium]
MSNYLNEARRLLRQKDCLRAAAALDVIAMEEILTENPDDADAWATLGEARGRLHESAGAMAAYRKAAELAPDDLAKRASLAWGH